MDQNTIIILLGNWSLNEGPLYQRLAHALEQLIVMGEIPAGTRLPAERWLAQKLAVSRSTITTAYTQLEQKELIESRHGSGSVVQVLSLKRTGSQRLTSNGLLARSPLFESLLTEPDEIIDFTTSITRALDSLSLDTFQLNQAELSELLQTTGYNQLGLPALRHAIAQQFTQMGTPTTIEQVLVTGGAQQAVSLATSLYIQRGDPVVLENPTYFGALDAFRAVGARLLPVPVDAQGLRVELLRRTLGTYALRLIYLTPSFHNPTGVALSRERRKEVARIAEEFGVALVEDNTFMELSLDQAKVFPPIAAYIKDKEFPILSIGTLNKLFWEGLRIGWVRAPAPIIEKLGRLKMVADLGTSLFSQAIALRLLGQLEQVRDFRQGQLNRQLALLTGLLAKFLPDWRWQTPDGGFFLWVRLPFGDSREFAQIALRSGVLVTTGAAMSADDSFSDYLRLPLLLEADILEKGVERLGQTWEAYSQLKNP